ncbi:ABC transporter ATP-binding protein [Lutibacter sp. B2]|nr:ABC transporter ATP-binding protein [Lutibacter sp. B2]
MNNILLKVEDLHIAFHTSKGSLPAIKGVSFEVEEGEILGIVGESGCGKSITSLALMGLLPQNSEIVSGNIYFENKNINSLKEEDMQKLRGNEISMIFQEPMNSLNPVYKIGHQMIEGLILHFGISKKEAKERTINMMKEVGLARATEIFNSYPHELSGGMRQRIMIAMALICKPKLLIADEPTTALDVTIQAQILELMKKINREMKTTIIFISHDIGVIAQTCDRVVVMYAGQVVEQAKVDEIIKRGAHPYTRGLMEAIPTHQKRGTPLKAIKGRVPSLLERAKGCSFASRCEKAVKQCTEKKPLLNSIKDKHQVRCFLAQEEGEA